MGRETPTDSALGQVFVSEHVTAITPAVIVTAGCRAVSEFADLNPTFGMT